MNDYIIQAIDSHDSQQMARVWHILQSRSRTDLSHADVGFLNAVPPLDKFLEGITTKDYEVHAVLAYGRPVAVLTGRKALYKDLHGVGQWSLPQHQRLQVFPFYYINQIAVLQNFERAGLGRALYAHIRKTFPQLPLLAFVARRPHPNLASRAFHISQGFTVICTAHRPRIQEEGDGYYLDALEYNEGMQERLEALAHEAAVQLDDVSQGQEPHWAPVALADRLVMLASFKIGADSATRGEQEHDAQEWMHRTLCPAATQTAEVLAAASEFRSTLLRYPQLTPNELIAKAHLCLALSDAVRPRAHFRYF